ncbi:MAG: hypothetical protein V3S85_05375 [Nitrospirales bacterium]
MKKKLSVTVEQSLVQFLDSLPGQSRSEKLEKVLRRFKEVSEDLDLRHALSRQCPSANDREEHEAWVRTMEHDQWSESAGAISGRLNS